MERIQFLNTITNIYFTEVIKMKRFRITELLISIVSAELVGALSALIAGGRFKEFFTGLEKPSFAPPAWSFPVAWALLYALMGYAAYLIYLSDSPRRSKALKLYAAQLAVNFAWTPVFFGLKSITGGLVIILMLDILVAMMIFVFAKIRRKAALAVMPYLLWCLYATYLTAGIFILNG